MKYSIVALSEGNPIENVIERNIDATDIASVLEQYIYLSALPGPGLMDRKFAAIIEEEGEADEKHQHGAIQK